MNCHYCQSIPNATIMNTHSMARSLRELAAQNADKIADKDRSTLGCPCSKSKHHQRRQTRSVPLCVKEHQRLPHQRPHQLLQRPSPTHHGVRCHSARPQQTNKFCPTAWRRFRDRGGCAARSIMQDFSPATTSTSAAKLVLRLDLQPLSDRRTVSNSKAMMM